jgi:hypothetical protein
MDGARHPVNRPTAPYLPLASARKATLCFSFTLGPFFFYVVVLEVLRYNTGI